MSVATRMRDVLALGPEWWWRGSGQARHASARQSAERRRRDSQDLSRVDCTHDDDRKCLRNVVTEIKARQGVARQCAHELWRTDDLASVWMPVEELRVQLTRESTPRVVVAEAHFLENDVLLLFEHVRIERGVHRDVGEHLEPGDNAAGRKRDVVIGVVPRRPRVHTATDSLDVALHETSGTRRRTAEEHVLEIVRKAELGGCLIARAGTDPQLQRDDVTASMFLNDYRDTVGENMTGRARRCGSRARSGSNAATSPTHREDEQRETDGCHPDHKP